MRKLIILLTFSFIFIFGCAPIFQVQVNSLSTHDAESKKRYVLIPGTSNVDPNDLQFKEYSMYVEKALNSKGFIKADNLEEANVAILLLYGVGDPQIDWMPVFGQTGVSSSTTYGNINIVGNMATYSGWTTYTPTYGIVGFMPELSYLRFIIIDAVNLDEYKQNKKIVPLWKTIITSTGRVTDLRRVFPVLIAAAKPYIGTNTGKIIKIKITENDERVIEIKGLNKDRKQEY